MTKIGSNKAKIMKIPIKCGKIDDYHDDDDEGEEMKMKMKMKKEVEMKSREGEQKRTGRSKHRHGPQTLMLALIALKIMVGCLCRGPSRRFQGAGGLGTHEKKRNLLNYL